MINPINRWQVILLTCFLTTIVAAGEDSFTVEGYRAWPYKAPTPHSAPGATTLFFTDDVRRVIKDKSVVLVNVSPVTLSPPDADGQRFWIVPHDKPALQIPESIWLPNVGYETLDPAMFDYLELNLAKATDNDKTRHLLIYCTADCWMSWNAVKRAGEQLGYRNIYWYPYGIDGWKEDSLTLESATPVPFQ